MEAAAPAFLGTLRGQSLQARKLGGTSCSTEHATVAYLPRYIVFVQAEQVTVSDGLRAGAWAEWSGCRTICFNSLAATVLHQHGFTCPRQASGIVNV